MRKITLLLTLIVPMLSFGQFNVTFQVDMNQYSGMTPFTIPEVNGEFNNWCGNCAAMADGNGDNIWDIVIQLPADTFEFKFSADNWGVQESLTPGSPCTVTAGMFTNRTLVVTGDTVLAPVCWESCVTCGGTPANSNVTFRVDLSEYTASTYTNVHLNGSFNNWCGTCAPMASPNNDSIYELVVSIPTGDTAEFLFTLDGFTVQESFTPGAPCTKTTGMFTNRSIIPAGDTLLPPVCWESCAPCGVAPPVSIDENWLEGLSIGPNPNNGLFTIAASNTLNEDLSVVVYDATGKIVYQNRIEGGSSIHQEIELAGIKNGIYMLSLSDGKTSLQKKIVISN